MSAIATAIRPRNAGHDQVAANDAAKLPDTARREIYHLVHKGIRACMSETLVRLGRVDVAAPESVAAALAAVTELLQMCAEHLAHENTFLHTAMERAQPGSAKRCTVDHDHHVKTIAELQARLAAVQAADGPGRERALKVLYRLLALFIAENFEHMEVEESENTALLQTHYADQDLLEIEQAIHAHIKPERMMVWLRWMLPNVTRRQRAEMMKGVQAGMPPEVFAAVLEMIKPHLIASERAALSADLS